MSRPLLLDLFCGAGGAATGYHRAGFDIIGVDIAPQPHYPFEFHQADALEYVAEHGHHFDAIHASPPCQAHTALRHMWNAKPHPDLIPPTREALRTAGRPYVIENVPGSPLAPLIMLCGTAFGLGIPGHQLRRHRWFEPSGFWLMSPPCQHHGRAIGVYGGGSRKDPRRPSTKDFSTDERRAAMGIDWMSRDELNQAIPPAYTHYIGTQLHAHIQAGAA